MRLLVRGWASGLECIGLHIGVGLLYLEHFCRICTAARAQKSGSGLWASVDGSSGMTAAKGGARTMSPKSAL